MNYNICVISSGRAKNTPQNIAFYGKQAYFFVAVGEGAEYKKHGAINVIESGKPMSNLIQSRNAALDFCFSNGKICVQVDDDLQSLKRQTFKTTKYNEMPSVDAITVIQEMIADLNKTKFKLSGLAPTANGFFAKKPYVYRNFIIGDFMIIKSCNLRFDTNLSLKEDYDYTLQHIERYGGALRNQKFLANFLHYNNGGGVVAYRNEGIEFESVAYLQAKWGDSIRLNSKRKNEILLNTKSVRQQF